MDYAALQAAIEAAIDGDGTLPGLIGTRRYFHEAPDDTDWPFVVYIIMGPTPSRQFDADDLETYRIQFSAYAKGHNPATASAIIKAIDAVFNRGSLTVVGWGFMSSLRLGGQAGREADVFHHWADYEITLS